MFVLMKLRLLIFTSILLKFCDSIAHFLSSEELRYTFGVRRFNEVPSYSEILPEAIYSNGTLETLIIKMDGIKIVLAFEPSTSALVSPHLITIHRRSNGRNRLYIGRRTNQCHFHHKSNHTFAAVSTCDGHIKGVIIKPGAIFVIHPFPDRFAFRFKRDEGSHGLHVIYKRNAVQNDFCGIDSLLTAEELANDDNEVSEDLFVIGQRFVQESDLIVELAIFVDELLWRHFSSKYGGQANQKLEDYALTMLNNIQIMYQQPTAMPPLIFRVVRFEVLSTQPVALAAHLHNDGHAQKYLDKFCRYQRSLGNRDWDHAILLTGYDIHRGSGSRSISGIARLDGMCDPWNTCTLAEGLDFTSAFIGTHEIGHSLGMRHDEPYCASKHIMSSSLGPGKVTWSTCSMRDYHAFLQRLDLRGRNCLRVSNLPQKLTLRKDMKPGQVYSADEQCRMMHGDGYRQITPRQDHYDGICNMMWCGQTTFGRIITSHPALEGTFCGSSKWCELGRCVPWTGKEGAKPSPISPQKIDGQWSVWSGTSCNYCSCSNLIGSIGVVVNIRSCTNPSPANGGHECVGSNTRGIICDRKCTSKSLTVDQYISEKCAQHKKLKSDRELTGLGSQLNRYPQRACKVFCDVLSTYGSQRSYRFFGDNLPNGAPCGSGKYCLNGDCLSLSCDGNALLPRDLDCPTDKCPLKSSNYYSGKWSVWSSWSFCSQTCGSGFRTRTRTCSGYSCEGSATDNANCNLPSCVNQPADSSSSWSEWTQWNQCSVTCGLGSQARYRRCISSSNSRSSKCTGETMETRNCDMGTCSTSVTGLWGPWTEWSYCSTTCGPGIQTRNRYCTKEPCDGSGQSRMSCNVRACDTPSKWAAWSAWSQCSQLCGKGYRTRSRSCSGTGCIGSSAEQQFCNEHPCTASNGQWSGWSVWSSCSVTCGVGVKRRTRHCQHGNCPGSHRDSTNCREAACEQPNSTWGGWGYWSTCSETCNQGIRKRVRKCYGLLNNASPKCVGNEYEREFCNLRIC